MAAKYHLLTTSDGQYYFNLKAANGKVILTSERYTTKANALNGIRSVQQNATIAARFDRRTAYPLFGGGPGQVAQGSAFDQDPVASYSGHQWSQ